MSKYKGTSQGPRQAIDRSTSLHGNGESLGTSSKSPSTPTESSSSEEESSSEESEYEDDEEMPVKDISEVSFNILARVPLLVTWAKTLCTVSICALIYSQR